MNIFKRVWNSIKTYRSEPTLNDCPDAPDALSVGEQFDQQAIQSKLGKDSKKEN
jgi:hypothetical protein